jgi:hypothetical protein
MPMPLPVGISTFEDIIRGGYLYVDKTPWIYELVRHPKGPYFLSRPRRFGKSLMVSILAEVFAGNRALFKGLWIDSSDYEWQPHPIIRIDFSLNPVTNASELEEAIKKEVNLIAQQNQLTLSDGKSHQQFRELIYKLYGEGQVVILIDEYDKPIIDNLSNIEEAKRIRELLKSFYTVIKGMDQYVRFVFLTGISKFSKVGVFSGLNNLEDLTMSPAFSAAVGITEQELRDNFGEHITSLAAQEELSEEELLAKIKTWYDGFCFSVACQPVYNPYSLLLLFKQKLFENYWFETGTPSFLVKLIKERDYDIRKLDPLTVGKSAFSSYELEKLNVVPILFQTGYLSIKGYNKKRRLYDLSYPNYEVENSFLEYLLDDFSRVDKGSTDPLLWQLLDALEASDFDEFFEIMAIFFANVPYDIQIAKERYYQTIFYLILKLMGLKVDAEARTNKGRIDTVVELDSGIIIFEFKLDGTAAEALQQIKQRDYAQKYRILGKKIYLVGVNFDSKKREIAAWQMEEDED